MTTSPQIPNPTPPAPRRGMRVWIPCTILILATAGIVLIRRSGDTEETFRTMRSFVTGGAAILLLLVWFLLFSRLRWQIRLGGLCVFILGVFALAMMVRIDGTYSGGALPRLAWRWTAPRGADLGDITVTRPVAATTAALPAFDSPSFLGTDHIGVIRGLNLETNWTARKPVELWRRKVGLGWSSFAVAGPRAITLEQRGEQELVVCYGLVTGNVLWTHANPVRFHETMGGDGPRATPTIAGERIYCEGATGILDCLELATGKLLWSRDTLKEETLPILRGAKAVRRCWWMTWWLSPAERRTAGLLFWPANAPTARPSGARGLERPAMSLRCWQLWQAGGRSSRSTLPPSLATTRPMAELSGVTPG